MGLSKPVDRLGFDDIQALVCNQEPESVTLEYRRGIDTSPGGKKELAKDVSAMANSQGGHLIIGLAEQDHRPRMPNHFIGRMLGNQKVEEWLDQVINSNIQQRANVHVKPIPVPGKPVECVVVMHVPPSSRVPHMVTAQNDNRYYVRHNCEVLPAEQYEVRDMYERGRRMREEVKEYVRARGYSDPDDEPRFAVNNLTKRLGERDSMSDSVEAPHTVISFVACPCFPEERINTSSSAFREWLDAAQRQYYPPGVFLPHEVSRDTLDGVVFLDRIWFGDAVPSRPIEKYLAIHRNGYVEYAYGSGVPRNEWRYIVFVKLVGRLWQFFGFVKDLYERVIVSGSAIVMLNMTNVSDTNLVAMERGGETFIASSNSTCQILSAIGRCDCIFR